MMNVALQMIIYCVILVVLAIPLGSYMGKVMNGERVFLSRLLLPVENLIYRGLRRRWAGRNIPCAQPYSA